VLAGAFVYVTQDMHSFSAWQFGLATAVSVLVTVLAGSALGEAAVRRSAAEKRVSATGLAVTAMLIGTIVYLGLSYWVGTLLVPGA